ncbi:MAG TPA: glycosyltransferase family 2 protein [Planctomycetota bacterium]|nr:glycosyltransferase family 2 protein [Planctomycetota bacterium]
MEETQLSVVLPAFNERDTIAGSLAELIAALQGRGRSWEVIVVDDGSTDGTSDRVAELIEQQPCLRLIRLSRNFGKENALSAGLVAARGDFVAILDADLQDPPAVMLEMLAKAETGFDVVYGVRRSRRGQLTKRFCYALYYRLLKFVSEPAVPLDSGDFCVLSRRVVDALNRMPERNRFLRSLRTWVGFAQCGHPYDRPERRTGKSKYTTARLFDLATTGVLASSRLPLMLSIHLGLLLAGIGFLWALKVLAWKVLYDTAPQGFAASIVAILVVGGCQLIAIGVMGTYLGRVLDQAENRPSYIIDRTINCPARDEPASKV